MLDPAEYDGNSIFAELGCDSAQLPGKQMWISGLSPLLNDMPIVKRRDAATTRRPQSKRGSPRPAGDGCNALGPEFARNSSQQVIMPSNGKSRAQTLAANDPM